MFLVNQLSDLIWGRKDMLQASGAFYVLDGKWRCIFNDCEITLRQLDEEFSSALVVDRLMQEGETVDEEGTQIVSPISSSMNFSEDKGLRENSGYSWWNTDNGKRYLFEFDDDKNRKLLELFQTTVCQCIYQSHYQRPSSEATDFEISQFLVKNPSSAPSTPTKQRESTVPITAYPLPPPSPTKRPPGSELLRAPARLFLFDTTSKTFQLHCDAEAVITSTGDNKKDFSSTLTVDNSKTGELVLTQSIDNAMFMHFNQDASSVIWVYTMGNYTWTWSLVFPDPQTDRRFKEKIAICLWERNSGKPWAKGVKEEDADWIMKGLDDDVAMEADDGLQDSDMLDFIDPEEEKRLDEESEEEEEEESDEEESEDEAEFDGQSKNSLLSVGYSSDRSFVVRGSNIGVFKHTPDNKLKFATRINSLKGKDGKPFSPKKTMLHKQDESMLLLHPDQNKSVFRMDLNRGDIVEEWKVDDSMPVNELFPQTKYSQMSSTDTVMGLNNLGFMYIDPRLPSEKLVKSQSYFYKPSSKPALSCAATTGKGQMVLGTKNGDIRMFSEKMTKEKKKDPEQAPRAKTTLPGFGDPIIGIDVSEDGEWILGTCKTYLLVIPTKLQGGKSGFETPMGKEKPAPRRLQLHPEHIAEMGGKISFTPARFNTGSDREKSIVTSTGPYIITWNFRKVKQSKLNEPYTYQIKRYKEDIVADQFRYGNERAIVVTTPNDVSMARKVVTNWSSPRK